MRTHSVLDHGDSTGVARAAATPLVGFCVVQSQSNPTASTSYECALLLHARHKHARYITKMEHSHTCHVRLDSTRRVTLLESNFQTSVHSLAVPSTLRMPRA